MKKITLLIFALAAFCFQSQAQTSTLYLTMQDIGCCNGEKWVSVTTGPDGTGTIVFAQGNGTYGNGSGLLTDATFTVTSGTTYYINAYDQYDDGWDGDTYEIRSAPAGGGTLVANNGGVSPDDGNDEDSGFQFGNTQEQELESSEAFTYVAPSCPDPQTLAVNNITSSSADLSWAVGNAETEWEYALQLASDPAPTSGTTISSLSFAAMTLLDNTAYTFYVRANCTASDSSDFISVNFSTLVIAPANDLCSNATAVVCGTSLIGETTVGATGGSSTSCQGSIGNDVWYSFVGDGSEVTFTANSTPTTEEPQIDVYESTDGTCGTISCVGTRSGGGANPYEATIATVPGTSYYISIGNWINNNPDISFDLTVTCVTCLPVSGLAVSNIIDTGAQFDWTPNNNPAEMAWEYAILPAADAAPTSGTSITTNTHTDASLTESTDYIFYVRADCGGGDFSTWEQVAFTTTATCPDPTGLSVGSITETTAEVSWNQTGPITSWDIELVDITAGETASGTANEIGVTNPFTLSGLTGLNDYEVYVQADCSATWIGPVAFTTNGPAPANDECSTAQAITVNTDFSCGTVTSSSIAFATASPENTSDCGGTEDDDVWFSFVATATTHRIVLSNITGGTTDLYHSLWEGTCGGLTLVAGSCSDPNTSNPSGLTIGNTYLLRVYSWTSTPGQTSTFDICIGTPPTCAVPTAGSASAITDVSADLSWTENNAATSWNIEWGADGFVQGAGTVITGTGDNPYSLSGLSATTAYDFYVQSDCGGGDLSAWAGPYSFTTAVDLTIECGQIFTDTGGISANYSNGENTTWTVCPTTPGEVVSITFNSFEVEGDGVDDCYDALFIYDGADNTGTPITPGSLGIGSDNNTTGFCFESAIDGNGNLTGQIITSTDASGCITFTFTSDNSAQESGWDATVTCAPPAPVNDDCPDAIGIALATDIAFDNTGASDSGQSSCYSGDVRDLWYSFVAPASGGVTITVGAGTQYSLFSACSTADEVSCNQSVNSGLTAGNTYYVSVTDDGTNRIPGASTLRVDDTTTLSTADFNSESIFSYYPNPVKNRLTLNAQQAITNVTVFNMLGQEVIRIAPNAVSNELDMSRLQSGAYFVKVTVGSQVQTVRIIKN